MPIRHKDIRIIAIRFKVFIKSSIFIFTFFITKTSRMCAQRVEKNEKKVYNKKNKVKIGRLWQKNILS